jgi:plasmid stability protein
MANLTIALDDDLLRAARIKAVQQGTSVNEICREAIARFAAPAVGPDDFLAELRALAARVPKATDGQPAWLGRDAMYEEAMAERMPTLWATFQPSNAATALAIPAAAVPGTAPGAA